METLREAIARHQTCRCQATLGVDVVGITHPGLPVTIPMCRRCYVTAEELLPAPWVWVMLEDTP